LLFEPFLKNVDFFFLKKKKKKKKKKKSRARSPSKRSPARGFDGDESDEAGGDHSFGAGGRSGGGDAGMDSFSEYLERYAEALQGAEDEDEDAYDEEEEDADEDDDRDGDDDGGNDGRRRGRDRYDSETSSRSDGEYVRQSLVIKGLLAENKAMYGIRSAQDELVEHLTQKLRAREARDGDIRNAIDALTRRVRELEAVVDVKNQTISALSGVIKDMAVPPTTGAGEEEEE
jgi:hypothetical protein